MDLLLFREGASRSEGYILPSKRTSEGELNQLISQQGLVPFLETTQVLVGLLSAEARLVLANPALAGWKSALSGPEDFQQLVVPSARAGFDQLLREARQKHQVLQGELDLGLEKQPQRCRCLFVPLEDGRVLFFGEPAGLAFDLTEKYQRLLQRFEEASAELTETRRALERKQKEVQAVIAQADEVSHIDSLTLLANRRQIVADLQRQVTFSERYEGPFSVSMLDFDHFKEVNDRYGHAVGDSVLRFVALLLRDHVRSPDILGRYGGEEFLLLLPNSTVKAAGEQAERLCQLVRSTPITSGEITVAMTISMGIAQYRIHRENWEQLLNRVDLALYQAKNRGRDQWAVIE
ncbi:MAG TPA: diguanylate cyclase [Anaerolineales bacterium]|nr:diguanylate cyclase [Anaerolineales bacterium]